VRCLYPFAGQNESELPFQENEELEILGKPADDPEWERGEWKRTNTTSLELLDNITF
jgi:hypothetical protein